MQRDDDQQAERPVSRKFVNSMTAAERQKRACELRALNYDFDDIAKELGYADRSGAWRAVRVAIARLPAPAATELRRMQVADLLEIHRAHFPYAVGVDRDGEELTGEDGRRLPPSKDAAEVCLKVAARIAAMYGLDQPKSLRVELDREVSMMLDKLQKALPPDVYDQVLAIASREEGDGEAEGEAGGAEADDPDPDGT
jgi:hypothetical protein